MKKFIFILFLGGIGNFLSPFYTQEPTYYWESFDTEIEILSNGDFQISETLNYLFTENYIPKAKEERRRWIPTDKLDSISNIQVFEDNKPIVFTKGNKGNQVLILWKHQLKPPKKITFQIKYRVQGGLRVESEILELFWKCVPSNRKSPIKSANVTLKLPQELVGKAYHINATNAEKKTNSNEQTLVFSSIQTLQPNQEFLIHIFFPQDIMVSTPKWQTSSESKEDNQNKRNKGKLFIILPLIILSLCGLLLLILVLFTFKLFRKGGGSPNTNNDNHWWSSFSSGGSSYSGGSSCGGGGGGAD